MAGVLEFPERPFRGAIEEVVRHRSSGALLRVRNASGSALLFVPTPLRLNPAPGLWISGFVREKDGLLLLQRGVVYPPPPQGSLPPRPHPGPLLVELGVPQADFSALLKCAQELLRGEKPPSPPEGCSSLAQLLATPYGDLIAWGYPPSMAQTLWEAFGPGALEYLALDPYAPLAHGVSFAELDRLYLRGGLDPDHPQRYVAYARHFLERHFARTGDTVVSLGDLEEALKDALPLFLVGFSYGEERGEMLAIRNELTLRRWREIEGELAQRLLLPKKPPPIRFPKGLQGVPSEAVALLKLLEQGQVVLLLGGAGTGKTTIVRHVVEAVEGAVLLAPTGKAAARLKEATGREAFTVHAAILKEELLAKASLVVVDEAGMLGSETLWLLVRQLGEAVPLLLVGDPMQLPPVEPGHPCLDLAEHLLVLWLTKTHRSQGAIALLAEGIRSGTLQEAPPPWGQEVALRPLEEAFLRELFRGFDPKRTVLLTPLRRGRWGTGALNDLAATALGHRKGLAPGIPVVYLRNNPLLGYANGETDWLERFGADGSLWTQSGRVLPPWAARDLEPAYALTVHRSQGSEWEEVYVLLPREGLGLMDRSWLYTAATRARKRLVFLEESKDLFWEVYRKEPRRRRTLLRGFLSR